MGNSLSSWFLKIFEMCKTNEGLGPWISFCIAGVVVGPPSLSRRTHHSHAITAPHTRRSLFSRVVPSRTVNAEIDTFNLRPWLTKGSLGWRSLFMRLGTLRVWHAGCFLPLRMLLKSKLSTHLRKGKNEVR